MDNLRTEHEVTELRKYTDGLQATFTPVGTFDRKSFPRVPGLTILLRLDHPIRIGDRVTFEIPAELL